MICAPHEVDVENLHAWTPPSEKERQVNVRERK